MDKMVRELLGSRAYKPLTGYGAPSEPERRAGLWVGKAGARFFPEGFARGSGGDRRTEWGALLTGRLTIRCRGRSYPAQGGESYLLPPGCEVEAVAEEAPFIVWFEVCGDSAADFPEMCGYPEAGQPSVCVARYAQVKNALEIARCLHERQDRFGYAACARLWAFVAGAAQPVERPGPWVSREICQVLRMAEEDPIRNRTLREMAAIAGLPVETFRKRFLAEVGTSPVRYFLERKLDRAKELLTQEDMPVYRVAEYLGFLDVYYFSRLFKRHVGVAPKFYAQYQMR